MIEEAVLLCGGRGTRLRPLTDALPKALIEYKGKPLLQHQLEWLASNGIARVILATGHLSEAVEEYIGKIDPGIRFLISKEEESMGTAGALRLALTRSRSERILVANVDDLNDIRVTHLEKIRGNVICTSQARLPFGLIHEKDGLVEKFDEKPILDSMWVSMGVYLLNKDIQLPEKGSIEYDVFPFVKELRVHKHLGFWKTINTLKDLE